LGGGHPAGGDLFFYASSFWITTFVRLVSANLLIPKIIGSRVNIGPVAAAVGMLFLELAVGRNRILAGHTVNRIRKAGCGLPILPYCPSPTYWPNGHAWRHAGRKPAAPP
jgi:hypothetical protein